MRLHLCKPVSSPEPGLLPDAALLERARNLATRFADARLREVPLVRARELDRRADPTGATRVWLAVESMQVTGSFKVRGALLAIAAICDRATQAGDVVPHVIAASAGNHGAGVAYAAKALGVRATVVVPSTVPHAKRDRISGLGAEVRFGPTGRYDDAEAAAIALATSEKAYFLSPYDDLDVLAGNGASLGYEIARALGRAPENVLAPIGGGGLATGLACAKVGRVWGIQSEACAAAAQSLESGRAVEQLEAEGDTLADGLEGGISARAFARVQATVAGVGVVSERAVAGAMAFAVKELGLVLEGSAACALAPALEALPAPLCGGDLVLVLTGRNVDQQTLSRARAV